MEECGVEGCVEKRERSAEEDRNYEEDCLPQDTAVRCQPLGKKED